MISSFILNNVLIHLNLRDWVNMRCVCKEMKLYIDDPKILRTFLVHRDISFMNNMAWENFKYNKNWSEFFNVGPNLTIDVHKSVLSNSVSFIDCGTYNSIKFQIFPKRSILRKRQFYLSPFEWDEPKVQQIKITVVSVNSFEKFSSVFDLLMFKQCKKQKMRIPDIPPWKIHIKLLKQNNEESRKRSASAFSYFTALSTVKNDETIIREKPNSPNAINVHHVFNSSFSERSTNFSSLQNCDYVYCLGRNIATKHYLHYYYNISNETKEMIKPFQVLFDEDADSETAKIIVALMKTNQDKLILMRMGKVYIVRKTVRDIAKLIYRSNQLGSQSDISHYVSMKTGEWMHTHIALFSQASIVSEKWNVPNLINVVTASHLNSESSYMVVCLL